MPTTLRSAKSAAVPTQMSECNEPVFRATGPRYQGPESPPVVGLGGAGAIGWPTLAIGAAFGLLAWMRRRDDDD